MSTRYLPLVVIVGPTASGKTAAAIELAEKYDGEIICADSRTIYTGMDIGTAKPSPEERARVSHHGIDLVEPGQPFSAANFKKYTLRIIAEIRERGHIPILVGGSGLYVDAVVFDFEFGDEMVSDMRASLERMSLGELYEHCIQHNIELPENRKNKRYIVREIERHGVKPGRRTEPIVDCLMIGITTDSSELRDRIVLRSEQIFDNGVVDEAKRLGEKYGWDSEAMTGNIYPLVRKYLQGEITDQQMRDQFSLLDWRLAKRQMTWLRRNSHIEWCTRGDVTGYVDSFLVSEY